MRPSMRAIWLAIILLHPVGFAGGGDAGVVDHDVEPAVARDRLVDLCVERRRVGDVEHRGVAAHFGGHGRGGVGADVVDDDCGAVGGEPPGEGGPHT